MKMPFVVVTCLFCVALLYPVVAVADVLEERSFASDGKTSLGNGFYAIRESTGSIPPQQVLQDTSHKDSKIASLSYELKIVSGSRKASRLVQASFDTQYQGLDSLSGSTHYEEEKSASHIFLILKVSRHSKTRRLANATVKTAVSKAFKENIKRALNAYGDSYISSIDYGASLCAIVEVTETAYATKLRKNLNASGESVIMSGKAAVEDKLQEAGKNSNLNIRIMSKGYDTPRIDSHDVASLISTMNNMPTVEGGVELFLNTTPISGLMPNLKEKIDKIISDQKANVAKYSTALNEHEEYKYKISLRRDHKGLFEGRSVSDSEAKKWCTECGKKVEELIKNLEFYQSYSMHAVPLPTSLSRSWKDPELKTFTWDTGTDSIANRKKHKVTEVWIKIKTSKKGSGGTDSTIHAGFKNLDPSGGWQLSKSDLHKDKFEAGHWDRFNVTFKKPYTLNDFTRPGCKFWLKGKDMSYSDKWTIDAMRVYLKVPTWKPGEQGLYHLIYTRDKDKNITKTSTYYFEFNRLPGASLTDDWNHFIQ